MKKIWKYSQFFFWGGKGELRHGWHLKISAFDFRAIFLEQRAQTTIKMSQSDIRSREEIPIHDIHGIPTAILDEKRWKHSY
jgi:hypothetical protein